MDYPSLSGAPFKRHSTGKAVLAVVVILVVILLLVGGGAGLYYFLMKKRHDIIESCECDSSPLAYNRRVDAVKSDAALKKKWDACGGHPYCQQETCLTAGYCFAPVFTKDGKSGAPWCFKKIL